MANLTSNTVTVLILVASINGAEKKMQHVIPYSSPLLCSWIWFQGIEGAVFLNLVFADSKVE